MEKKLKLLFSKVYREKPDASRAVSSIRRVLIIVLLTDDSRRARRPISWLSLKRPRLLLKARLQIAMITRINEESITTITVQCYDELVKLIINLAMSRHEILRYE